MGPVNLWRVGYLWLGDVTSSLMCNDLCRVLELIESSSTTWLVATSGDFCLAAFIPFLDRGGVLCSLLKSLQPDSNSLWSELLLWCFKSIVDWSVGECSLVPLADATLSIAVLMLRLALCSPCTALWVCLESDLYWILGELLLESSPTFSLLQNPYLLDSFLSSFSVSACERGSWLVVGEQISQVLVEGLHRSITLLAVSGRS